MRLALDAEVVPYRSALTPKSRQRFVVAARREGDPSAWGIWIAMAWKSDGNANTKYNTMRWSRQSWSRLQTP